MSKSKSDWAGYSSTIIGGQLEMGGLNSVFGHYEIEVRVPRTKTAGALWGVAIGGVIGGAIGMGYAIPTVDEVEDVECGPELGDEICNTSIDVARVVGHAFAFGAPGMLLGGIIGASLPGECWQRVDLPGTVSVRPGRDGTVFLEYTLSF